MLNNWNTMENANLLERKLLRRADELPIGTVIYGLNNLNEVSLWVVNKRCDDKVYLYETLAYAEKTYVVKTDDKEVCFKDTDIQGAREYFKNKTFNLVDIDLAENSTIKSDLSTIEPNTSKFYFNTYPISKSKKVEVKVEIKDTDDWISSIPYNTYVLPAFNSDFSRYYPNIDRLQLQQIAKNIHSELKYRFKNPNEYEVCNYLIYSKDSYEDKLKIIDKLKNLPDNYNVVDIEYNKYNDKIIIRIDEAKVDLNTKISDGVVKLLDLQECHHCNCNTCKYHSKGICCKNVQMMQDNTPCYLYSPYSLYKLFKAEWDKSTEEDKKTYLDYVKKSLHVNGNRITISRSKDSTKNTVIYYADNIDKVFEREPNEVIKANYKVTYYSRRKKNQRVVEKL